MTYDPNFTHPEGGLDPSAHEVDPEPRVDDEEATSDLDQIHAAEGGAAGEVQAWDPDTPLLEIEDLDITFTTSGGDVPAVRGANLTVYPGQTVAIVGESGSGKTTTAMAVAGLLAANGTVSGGSIRFRDEEISKASRTRIRQLRGDQIGMVPQDPMSNLNPLWKIGFQVKEALTANKVAKGKQANRRVVELLEEAGLPDAARRANQFPHEFSGGMRQRALIAMGLAARPSLLIADEPTSALDVTVQRQILDHLDTLTGQLGVAVLLITHDLGLAAERAQHLVVMYRGRVVESGPALEILQKPQHPYTKRLIAAAPSLGSTRMVSSLREREREDPHAGQQQRAAGAERTDDVVVAENLTRMFDIRGGAPWVKKQPFTAVDDVSFTLKRGTTLGSTRMVSSLREREREDPHAGQQQRAAGAERTDDVVVAENLTRMFDIRGGAPWVKKQPFTAVDDVSFTLKRGTTLGIVGESGSGKSTVAQMVLRLLPPTSGTVHFEGRDLSAMSGSETFRLRRKVQPVFQNPYGSIDPTYSIFRTIEEPLRLHRVGTRSEREARVRELLDQVSLPAATMQRYPHELSGGQRQRVAIARAMALQPELLVLDEAVSALDVLVQDQVLELLNDLQAELDLSFLFITHDLAVVRQIADDVMVMEHGRVVEYSTAENVFRTPQTAYTQKLLDAIPGGSIPLAGSGGPTRPDGRG